MSKISSQSNMTELIDIDEHIEVLGLSRRMSLDEFNSISLRNKTDVVNAIGEIYEDIHNNNANSHYYKNNIVVDETKVEDIKRLLERLYVGVKNDVFPEALEPWWSYSFKLTETGASLFLNHYVAILLYPDGGVMRVTDKSIRYLDGKAEVLDVEQYAKKCGVSEVAVRQWIRRGKLRCAIKTGNGWKIPNLSIKAKRGYNSADYKIDIPLEIVPKEYPFLKGKEHIIIIQDKTDKNIYNVSFANGVEEVQLSKAERERFELYLISSTDFKAEPQTIISAGDFEDNYRYLLEKE